MDITHSMIVWHAYTMIACTTDEWERAFVNPVGGSHVAKQFDMTLIHMKLSAPNIMNGMCMSVHCLGLILTRYIRSRMHSLTERLLKGRKESNQTKCISNVESMTRCF